MASGVQSAATTRHGASAFGKPSRVGIGINAVRTWFNAELERETAARTSFVLFPIGMLAAIALFYASALRPPLVFTVCALALSSLLLAPWVHAVLLRLAGRVLLGAAAGFVACQTEVARTDTVVISGDATVRIAGTVVSREEDERGRFRYVVEIERTERPVLSRPPEKARIVVSSRHEPIPIGGRYTGLVRLRPPSGPAYPGAHDFAYGAYFGGLGAYGFSLGAPVTDGSVRPLGFSDRIATLRLAMGDRIRAVLPGPTGAVAAALITGERAGIPDEINEDLRVTGLAHVLSISGFHMALVAGFFMFGARVMLAPLALHWPVKKLAALSAMGATGFYFLLAGDNAATERSFIMIAVMLGAVLLDRPALTLRNVAIAAIVVMALSPHVVLTATFQMSFAATAALIGAYGAYARWQRKRGTISRSWFHPKTVAVVLFGMALSSIIAGAATAPYGIYHFQRAAPFALAANLVATPIFSFWIMPLAMLSVLAMPVGFHAPFLHAMGWGLDAVFALADRLAEIFPDYAVDQMSGLTLALFTAAILLASFCASSLRWLGVLPAAAGLVFIHTGPRPELLVFESGKELALIDEAGGLHALRARPTRFVWDQWTRAFPPPDASASSSLPPIAGALPDDRRMSMFRCENDLCHARTRSGLVIGWSDDYQKLSELCRTSDVAVMARAVRAERCYSGAPLVTLRTLRRTGSLAVSRGANGSVVVASSVPPLPSEWNVHRLAAWPEYWTRDETEGPTGSAASDSAESAPPASPEP